MSITFIARADGQEAAFLFTGQGAQSVGMGQQLFDESPAAKLVFQQIDYALGRSLTDVMFNGPEDVLRQTINAQPGILAVSLACVKAMEETLGPEAMPRPVMPAGHSLGEYTALAVAGVLDIGDAAILVQRRGELMQEACDKNPGTMAAILGLDESVIEDIVRETGIFISNINTAEQVVISGEVSGVASACDLALENGARKAIPLNVGGAFHSGRMEPAVADLAGTINDTEFHDPNIPVIANCTAIPLASISEVKAELISQVCSCVQWKRTVDYMIDEGITEFIEIGPGKALSGMVKRISRDANVKAVSDMAGILNLTSD